MRAGRDVVLALVLGVSSVAVAADDVGQRSQEAMAVTQSFMKELGKTMMGTMKAQGPVAAIKVCAEKAPELTAAISRRQGWKVTRVGTRVRNPMLGMPDVWEQKVLAQFQARLERGEPIKGMYFSEVVNEPDGRYFRFAKAIGVKPKCLICHGAEADIPAPVRQHLKAQYPFDQATGYRAGELRGAVTIKQPLISM